MGSEERLAGEKSERKLAGERRQPLDRGTKQEKTKEGLQVVKEMSRKVKKTKEYPVMRTAATRGVLQY